MGATFAHSSNYGVKAEEGRGSKHRNRDKNDGQKIPSILVITESTDDF